MRGRTNITQRATPYVNGQVINAEVETGTINVGDFVEYKKEMVIRPCDFASQAAINPQLIGNDYIVAKSIKQFTISSTTPTLALYKRSTQELLSQLSFDYDFMFFVDNDNIFVMTRNDFNFQSINNFSIYYIKVVNESFSIIDRKNYTRNELFAFASMTPNGSYCTSYLFSSLGNNKFVLGVIASNYLTNYQTYNNVNVIFEYDSNGIKSNEIGVNQTNAFSGVESTIYSYVMSVSNYSRVHTCNISSENILSYMPNGTLYAVYYKYDSSYNVTAVLQSFTYSPASPSVGELTFPFILNNKHCVYRNSIVIFNELNEVFEKYTFSEMAFGSSTDFARVGFNDVKNRNVFYIVGHYYERMGSGWWNQPAIIRFKFNEVSKTLEKTNELRFDEPFIISYLGLAIYDVSDKIYLMSAQSNANKVAIINYYSDTEIDMSEDKDYVKPYNGGKAIGFAKTSGVEGDNVKIYVPIQNV